MTDGLSIWVVTAHPSDFPEYYVARRNVATAGVVTVTADIIKDPELDRLRRKLQQLGLVKLDRMPEDDPVIVENWL